MENLKNDELLCGVNDAIDNTVYDALQIMAYQHIDWNMEMIGEVTMCIERVLTEHNIPVCHPWEDENENICYATADRCKHCSFKEVISDES